MNFFFRRSWNNVFDEIWTKLFEWFNLISDKLTDDGKKSTMTEFRVYLVEYCSFIPFSFLLSRSSVDRSTEIDFHVE